MSYQRQCLRCPAVLMASEISDGLCSGCQSETREATRKRNGALPLGIIPLKLWAEAFTGRIGSNDIQIRINAQTDALRRYTSADLDPPWHWNAELNGLYVALVRALIEEADDRTVAAHYAKQVLDKIAEKGAGQ